MMAPTIHIKKCYKERSVCDEDGSFKQRPTQDHLKPFWKHTDTVQLHKLNI